MAPINHNDENAEIIKIFERIKKTDPNALANLKKLAEMAEKQPAKYKLALLYL